MCPDEANLIKLLAGELPPDQRDATLSHLAGCPACRELYDSLQSAWDQLGQWQAPIPAHDLTGSILAAAAHESVRTRWYARSAIAAAILVAAGVGWTIGRLPAGPAAPTPISNEQLAQRIGLDALGGDVGAFDNVFSLDESHDGAVDGGQS